MKTYQGQEWSHKGLMFGIVPIYLNDPFGDCPEITVRHWLFEPLADLVEAVFSFACFVKTFLDPDFEPEFFFKVTGEA